MIASDYQFSSIISTVFAFLCDNSRLPDGAPSTSARPATARRDHSSLATREHARHAVREIPRHDRLVDALPRNAGVQVLKRSLGERYGGGKHVEACQEALPWRAEVPMAGMKPSTIDPENMLRLRALAARAAR